MKRFHREDRFNLPDVILIYFILRPDAWQVCVPCYALHVSMACKSYIAKLWGLPSVTSAKIVLYLTEFFRSLYTNTSIHVGAL